jgi:hypothetical protein
MVTAKRIEPGAANRTGVFGEGEFVMVVEAGPEPGGGVAEAFTGVFAPAAGAVTAVLGVEGEFSRLG